MRKALKLVPQPEEQFIERYERLHAWALALTNGNEDQADDLVHDAFIQFTLRRTELGTIQNTDSYLNRMLRNMFLSQKRRTAHLQQLPDSLADYDSAELGLRIVDPQREMQIADQLRRICQYASERKETYKGGSVLILRFFHGYFLDEIAQILCSPMDSIYSFLKIARREARLYLDDPDSLKLIVNASPNETAGQDASGNPIKLLTEMRNSIFASRRGACIEPERMDRSYAKRSAEKLGCGEVAHLVSCPKCLDEVNRMLDLPLLAERYPSDTLGQSDDKRDDQRRPGGGDDDGPKDGGSGISSKAMLKRKHSRRFKEVFDHRPQELRVSVNGFVLGSQKVGQELNEQTISVNIDERIGFIEVFSEQGVRLLFCDVDEPVDGDIEQRAEASFSNGRKLQLAVDFRNTWPTLHVLYRDPVLGTASVVQDGAIDLDAGVGDEAAGRDKPGSWPPVSGALNILNRWSHLLKLGGLWLRPATVTALVALVLTTAFLLMEFRRRPAALSSASSLLAQAAATEQALAGRTDQVIHRTLNLEERKSTGELIARHRVEVWQSAEKGITARRLYDDKGYLLRGDWRRQDGAETLYNHGSQPRIRLPRDKPGSAVTFDNAWQLDPSAKDFSTLMVDSGQTQVEERPTSYAINYENAGGNGNGLVSATLVLSRADLHATEQTLIIHQGDETREFRFIETAFEQRMPSSVAPAVFEPGPELVSADPSTGRHRNAEPISASPSLPVSVSPAVASSELEIEVLRMLNQVGADFGEQVSVKRSPEGQLLVEGVVDTAQRKAEILQALGSVRKNPAVRVDVVTPEEAASRQSRAAGSSIVLQDIAPTSSRISVDDDLRRYFSARGISGEQLDGEIQRFSDRMLARSRQMMVHAQAIRNLVQRFSAESLRTLEPEARVKWLSLIHGHAQSLLRELRLQRQQLAAVFNVGPVSDDGIGLQINDDASLLVAVERLFDLCAARDEKLRAAFSVSSDASTASALRGQPFWRALKSSEVLAEKIARAQ